MSTSEVQGVATAGEVMAVWEPMVHGSVSLPICLRERTSSPPECQKGH